MQSAQLHSLRGSAFGCSVRRLGLMDDNQTSPLPAPFVWVRIYPGTARSDVNVRLGSQGEAIAAVTVMSDVWYTTVNLHRPATKVRGAKCASCAQGMRWVTRWLEAHAARILVDIGQQREKLRTMRREHP